MVEPEELDIRQVIPMLALMMDSNEAVKAEAARMGMTHEILQQIDRILEESDGLA